MIAVHMAPKVFFWGVCVFWGGCLGCFGRLGLGWAFAGWVTGAGGLALGGERRSLAVDSQPASQSPPSAIYNPTPPAAAT